MTLHAVVSAFTLYSMFTARRSDALPLYADAEQSTYALVLCSGLDAAVVALREAELPSRAIGAAWLESNCISIDPCAETNEYGNAVAASVWSAYMYTWSAASAVLPRSSRST